MKDNHIAIIGAGESGTGAAILALRQGFRVFVSDAATIAPHYRQILTKNSIPYEENGHTLTSIVTAAEIIKSPGIPASAPVIQAARAAGTPIISEIEFAARYTRAKLICITGSNGKTTTSTLIYHMMKQAELNVALAGNIGKSFAQQVAENNFDYFVLELSSFQLDDMYNFRAHIAILLNITPDHLDRYNHNISQYAQAKMRITQNQTHNDIFIFCHDDQITQQELQNIVLTAQALPFSADGNPRHPGADISNGTININTNQQTFTMPVQDLSLKGRHNLYNSMAAGIAAQVLHIRNDFIRQTLSTFPGIEHRLEHVLTVNSVRYINDSKATNVNAAWYALESLNTPVVWIAGGTDKGNNYTELSDAVKNRVHTLICLGVDNSRLREAFSSSIPRIIETSSMHDAVQAAYRHARAGDAVLLSPACASFDLFNNYEDRGKQFKQQIRRLH